MVATPTKNAAIASWGRENWTNVLCLSRLVLVPSAPKNAATFLMMRSIRRLSSRWTHLVTYADTMMQHTGHICVAAGWEYRGLTPPEPAYRVNGVLRSRKSGPRTYSHEEMLARGAEYIGDFGKHKYGHVEAKWPAGDLRQAQQTPHGSPQLDRP